jgi:hypothetical protein
MKANSTLQKLFSTLVSKSPQFPRPNKMASLSQTKGMQVTLTDVMTSPGAFKTIMIRDGGGRKMEISLRRTLLVPENGRACTIPPPDCGPFPIYSVADMASRVSPGSFDKAKGGVFIPMLREYKFPVFVIPD